MSNEGRVRGDLQSETDEANERFLVKDNDEVETSDEHKLHDVSEVEIEIDYKQGRIDIETDFREQSGPDGGWGWFIVIGCTITLIITGGMERSAGVLFLKFDERFGRSAAVTAWVTSLSTVIDMMSGPLTSTLSNRFSARSVVITGSLLSAISILSSGFTPNLEFVFFSYGVLAGFGRSCMSVPAMVLVGLYFNKRRGLAVGLSTSGIGLGAFIIPPLVDMFFLIYGFTGAFILMAGVVLQVTICGALYRPLHVQLRLMNYDRKKILRGKDKKYVPAATDETDNTEQQIKHSSYEFVSGLELTQPTNNDGSTKRADTTVSKIYKYIKRKSITLIRPPKEKLIDLSLLRQYRFLMLCLAIMLFYLAFLTTNVFIPAYAKEQGLNDIQAASQLSFTGMLGTISRIASGIILDVKHIKPYRIVVYNGLMNLTSVSCVLIPRLSTFTQLSVSSAVYGVFTGSFLSQNSLVVIDVLGLDKLSTSYGIIMCFQGIGALCGPSIAGK
ncbi:hypothetical protein KUTeg_001291 [Tegillarca granosa]|uniref:Major facilitator superfamily (MFS) profile domain-containing protein n=1 Tax=Tegillarca granosa TaxID=220873 RepID=A0ABQ9FWQ4_TEGGR|nr:hypothetical protein KUTeg_001291 [Tegillarca granosa]